MASAIKRERLHDSMPIVRERLNDGLTNMVTGLGTDKDKIRSTFFATAVDLNKGQIDAAYKSDWITRKGVDIPAYDATREWREWQADSKDIGELEDVEKKLRTQQKTKRALTLARLYGGSALVLGVDQGTSDEELRVDAIRQGDLKFVHAVSRFELTAGPLDLDLTSPYYGEPQYYMRTTRTTGSLRIHPSRVVRFVGLEPADWEISQGWGDSVLQTVYDAVLAAGTVNSAVAQLVQEAKIDVVKIPEFSERIAKGDYEERLKSRFGTASMMKSVFSTLVMDREEEWERITANFQGLPDVLKMYLLIVSGAWDIPATRFLGQSPQGMNATGDSDTRNYYDRVSTAQKVEIEPYLDRLDEVLVRSALGTDPDGIHYNWRPLWQLSETEKATIAVQKANVMTADVNAALMPTVVLKKARENQLQEDGTYPGLEQIIEEFDEDPDLENEDDNEGDEEALIAAAAAAQDPALAAQQAAQAAAGKKGVAKQAAVKAPATREQQTAEDRAIQALRARMYADGTTPQTLYVYRPVINAKDIVKWAKGEGFTDIIDDLHVTIIYSKKPVDWLKAGNPYPGTGDDGNITIAPGGPRRLEQFGDYIVLAFASNDLMWRHMDIRSATDASWDYDDYTPHISITLKGMNADALAKLKAYTGKIVLGPEVFQPIDPEWSGKKA